MSIYDSRLWLEDIDKVIESSPWIKDLSGNSVLITGAGGLICSSVTDILLRYNEQQKGDIQIYAAARSKEKIDKRFKKYTDCPHFTFVPYDSTMSEVLLTDKADFIIHGASNASPDRIVKEPVETMISNFNGLLGLLEYGLTHGTQRLLFISSSEIYGRKAGNEPYKDGEYGYIDLLDPRNSYSIGKRASETLCISFSDEYGLETVIVRPGHIYGPTAAKSDIRVSSQWTYAAAKGEDIVMLSNGSQIRSYCYCLDCASALLTVLLKGKNRHAYNISSQDSVISIRQMAEILANSAHVQLKTAFPTDSQKKGFNPMPNSSLDGTNLQALGWHSCFDAETGFEHTVQILKESGKCC